MSLPISLWIVLKEVEKTAEEIKALRIRGATNVATQAVKALSKDLFRLDNVERYQVENFLRRGVETLMNTRETEPMMRNGLRYIESRIIESNWNSREMFKERVDKATEKILKLFRETKEKLTHIGSRRILNGATILTHCHSSSVIETLIKAYERGISFNVIQTETRPKYQGRITARELSEVGIDTTMIVDGAVRHFMKKADLVLVGCDAITSEGNVINKIGTSQVALAAHEGRIPFYILSTLLKFDPMTIYGEFEAIEERATNEIWDNPPKGLKIRNPAFDVTKRDYIHGIISEAGIISPHSILETINREYQWMLRDIS
jgi:ribose 1,5-bisphosphate isomerase